MSLLIDLGCGLNAPDGWVNVDTAIGARLARLTLFAKVNDALHIVRPPWPQGIMIHDLRKPLPWPGCMCRWHLPIARARALLEGSGTPPLERMLPDTAQAGRF